VVSMVMKVDVMTSLTDGSSASNLLNSITTHAAMQPVLSHLDCLVSRRQYVYSGIITATSTEGISDDYDALCAE